MDIKSALNSEFTLLDSKKNRVFLVVFLTVYMILFINIYVPFEMNTWYIFSSESQIIAFSKFGILGGIFLSFSQLGLRKWLNLKSLLLKHFIIWTILEIILLTLVITIFYDDVEGWSSYVVEYFLNVRYTLSMILLPYSIALLILLVIQYKSKIDSLKNKKITVGRNNLVKLPDDKGQLRFSLPLNDLLYLESTDNYVYIFYMLNGEIKKDILRNSLKRLDIELKDYPIIRCHRSYMVNTNNINLVKKSGRKMTVRLSNIEEVIPVSKTYHNNLKEFISMNN